jgi:putative ABC transport system substrate-binding protein
MRRREFITLLGVSAAWPLAASAQEGERIRHVGVLMNTAEIPDQRSSVAAFQQVLQQLGWTDGRNVRIDIRWGGGDASAIRRNAEDLVALAPDVIVAWDRCYGRRAPCRSSSTMSPTRSAPASSIPWHDRAAT